MEDFVTVEIAKKLKEKGFRKPCVATYDDDGMLGYNYYQPKRIHTVSFDDCLCTSDDLVLAPTISQVLKWLRERYIDISAYPIFTYEPNPNRIYETEIHTLQLNKSVKLGYYRTWEEAITEGIYYALDKLNINKV